MEDEMHKFLKLLEQFHVRLPCIKKLQQIFLSDLRDKAVSQVNHDTQMMHQIYDLWIPEFLNIKVPSDNLGYILLPYKLNIEINGPLIIFMVD
jgi:hypothetical protein